MRRRTINDLILCCMLSIESKKEKCSFERLMKTCFLFSPKTFGFKSYPKWPDARKLENAIERLRRKKLIRGGSMTFFSLTNQGKKQAQEIAKIFSQKKLL